MASCKPCDPASPWSATVASSVQFCMGRASKAARHSHAPRPLGGAPTAPPRPPFFAPAATPSADKSRAARSRSSRSWRARAATSSSSWRRWRSTGAWGGRMAPLRTTQHTWHRTAVGQPHPPSAQHSTAQHSTAQHSTAQHSTAQHSTAQHSTAAHRAAALPLHARPGCRPNTHPAWTWLKEQSGDTSDVDWNFRGKFIIDKEGKVREAAARGGGGGGRTTTNKKKLAPRLCA